jgi:hypothetical protein
MSDPVDPAAPARGAFPIEPVGDDYPVQPVGDDDTADAAPKAKVTVRSAAIVGVRVVAGVVGIAVAASAIAVAALVPLPVASRVPATVAVTPVPTAQQLVCPGGVLRLGDDNGQAATTSSAIGEPTVRYDSSSGTVVATPFEGSDASTGGTASAPLLISSLPGDADDDEILVAGAQSQSVSSGEFGGLTATDCAGVASETWLVGGATTVGRTTLVTLANPSDTVSTVSLAISSEEGKVSAPGATGIVVQPHGQRVLSLAGFAPDTESPVVHVVSRGGQIVANLQQATVRGLAPGGVDVVPSTQGPSTVSVIPGVVITGSAAAGALLGEDGYGDLATVLRVFVPGDKGADARVSVTSDDGATAGNAFSVDLEPGIAQDLTLDGLADGAYTVRVDTSEPVVASVRVSAVETSANSDGSADFAWLSSVDELRGSALVAVAPGPQPRLHLFNPADEDAEVTLAAVGGDDVDVTVAAGASVQVAVVAGETYRLDGFDRLYGAVSFAGDAQIAGYAVRPPAISAGPITIVP